jgi:hypothetical protein
VLGTRAAAVLHAGLRAYQPAHRAALRTLLDRSSWRRLPHAERPASMAAGRAESTSRASDTPPAPGPVTTSRGSVVIAQPATRPAREAAGRPAREAAASSAAPASAPASTPVVWPRVSAEHVIRPRTHSETTHREAGR